jgi:hypothetical protein
VRARHHPRRFRRVRSINNEYHSKSAQAHLRGNYEMLAADTGAHPSL